MATKVGACRNVSVPVDCRSCGVCCFSESPTYVRVMGVDWARLGADVDVHAHFIGHRAFMRMREGHCAALEVHTDATGNADFFCSVYDRRPDTCRDLQRGSPQCGAEQESKLPKRTLMRVAT